MTIREHWPWRRQPGDGRANRDTDSRRAEDPSAEDPSAEDRTGEDRAADLGQEPAALAWLCANLPELREKADRYAWRAELDREVAEVRAGKSAAEALRALNLRREGLRSSGLPAGDAWQERPVVERFRCPHGRCPARGRAADASEPRCHIDGSVMLPQDGG